MEHAHLFYAFFFALLGTLIVWIRRSKIKLVYPPGPKGFPLMGNIWDIPSTYEWLTYARWSQDFASDLIHLNLAGTPLIVLNSHKAAFELSEKRSAIYSDRPRHPMPCEMAILHDEKDSPDPGKFKPERFIKDGKLNPDVRDPDAAFGFGRRVCSGRHLAFSTLFLAIVSIVSMFDIGKAVDNNGQEIRSTEAYNNSGALSHPNSFKCSIKPRSSHAALIIAEAYAVHHP